MYSEDVADTVSNALYPATPFPDYQLLLLTRLLACPHAIPPGDSRRNEPNTRNPVPKLLGQTRACAARAVLAAVLRNGTERETVGLSKWKQIQLQFIDAKQSTRAWRKFATASADCSTLSGGTSKSPWRRASEGKWRRSRLMRKIAPPQAKPRHVCPTWHPTQSRHDPSTSVRWPRYSYLDRWSEYLRGPSA